MKNFTINEKAILSEAFRRLSGFGDVNQSCSLAYLGYKGEVKSLKKMGLLQPYSENGERGHVMNWYVLTEKGKKFMQIYIDTEPKPSNLKIYNGVILDFFDKKMLENL